mgnify:FL=1
MTGLEKIIQVIEAEGKAKAESILAEANEEAEKIIASAKEEAERKCAEIAEKPENEIKIIFDRAQSQAALIKRQMLLNAKQQVINDIIDKARLKLTGLPDDEYFEVILQIVRKYAHNEEGIIKFSKKDLERMPKKFEKKLNEAIKDMENARLSISNESIPIDGGFILVYGDVEENCSFEALFNHSKEELQDKVNAFLFG